jgi:hypothetical protein
MIMSWTLNLFKTKVSIMIFFVSALVWDTIYASIAICTAPAIPPCRRDRRFMKKHGKPYSHSLSRYPKRWLVLSAIMANSSQFVHPSAFAIHALQSTHDRIIALSGAVCLSPIVLLQFHVEQAKQSYSLLPDYFEEKFHDADDQYFDTGDHFFDSFSHEMGGDIPDIDNATAGSISVDSDYFGDFLTDDFNDAFFPCWESASHQQHELISLDFQDCIMPEAEVSLDLLRLDDLYDVNYVNCAFNCHEVPSASNCPSPMAYNATAQGGIDTTIYDDPGGIAACFPIIFDSGASLAISPSKADFVGAIKPTPGLRLGGMANGMIIEGKGIVEWSFRSGPTTIIVKSECYLVPDSKVRLISPQRLFNRPAGIIGEFSVRWEGAFLKFQGLPKLDIEYDERTKLPTATGRNACLDTPSLNLCVTSDENQNLSPSAKRLLEYHFRFGHRNMYDCQRILRNSPFGTDKFLPASKIPFEQRPKCEVCQYAKARRQRLNGKTTVVDKSSEGSLKDNHLRPGAAVSVDHFESRLKGRTYSSFGRSNSEKYVGGCIFVDHMSGYIHVEPQLGFSSSETIRAKQNYEKLCLDNGIMVDTFLADNGVFKANAFVQHIREHNQRIRYCGVNAHHQNGVAERSIRTISDMARAMMLHTSIRWKNGVDASLWPMATNYATYIYNHMPNSEGIAPIDLFAGTQFPRHKLKDIHVFGCPVYVLDPTLQSGKKLPKWQPRSRRGIFVGYSPTHSSDVPLILNTRTGHISPQFHVVFDDSFSTVMSLDQADEVPTFWNEFDIDEFLYTIPLDEGINANLDAEWLTPAELEERERIRVRSAQIRLTYPTGSSSAGRPASTNVPAQILPTNIVPTPTIPEHLDFRQQLPPATRPSSLPSSSDSSTRGPNLGNAPPTKPDTNPSSLRRSSRSTFGQSPSRYTPEAFCASINDPSLSVQEETLAYHAALETDYSTGDYNGCDPRAYAAIHRLHDPDSPSFHEAMHGPDSEHYINAMKTEIAQLLKQKTWERIPRASVPNGPDGKSRRVLKGTWVFKLKRLPDGSPLKHKARYCVRGDMQKEGIDYFETYAPVVQWSTIRLVLTMILSNEWSTKQVDYTNAFAQAEIQEEVYIDPPKGFGGADGIHKVLRLLKSLYGLKQAPKTFFDKLKAGLEERGFQQSQLDACLFMKKNMICLVYVDDTILASPDSEAIEREITGLGVSTDEQRHQFQLRDEGEVGDFLGIRIEKLGTRKFNLTQTGLINKVLKASDMETCNSVETPAFTTALGTDKEGPPFKESWKYATVIGMLMYLASNSRPDISFAVHQCARFTHAPQDSHAVAVKRILRYLQGTKEKGLIIEPTSNLQVDCYVDADFAGLWNSENDQDPICVKSRTGYLIMFMGCPLTWVSKLQTQIALSTMESEYIALSQSMRELIGIREVIKEIQTFVISGKTRTPIFRTFSKAFTLDTIASSTVYEDNEACLKFATMPKMSPRTKHIALPYHFFRTKVVELEIKVIPVSTHSQLADQFTKGLPTGKFQAARKALMGW